MGSYATSDECPARRFRTLFISDVHLGARGSQAERLLDFLRSHDADTIYLVGDIVDGWALRSNWHWPQSHNDFVQKMLRKARKGAKVIYVPGNHDEFLRNYYGTHFGGIDVVESTIHAGVDGRRYLVIHGDIFDLVVQNARWLALLGDKAYNFAIQINRLVNLFRRWFAVPYWSLSQWAKLKVKTAVNYIGAFEQALASEARRHGADGVICGHIHCAAIRDEHGVRYMNCGDWVESCTVLAEHEDGRFEIITWTDPHGPSSAVMVATPALSRELRKRGFRNVVLWPRGVDATLFHPRAVDLGLPRPVFLCVGRVAVEKNLEAFLDLDLPGTKVIVGDGPALTDLARKYPQAVFLGARQGEELAEAYAAADVFVFPSKTDTFGLVLLEALASGLPVAAFPVTGPRDVLGSAPIGALNDDLRLACLSALHISPQACLAFAAGHTWEASTRAFVEHIAGVRDGDLRPDAAPFAAECPRFVA